MARKEPAGASKQRHEAESRPQGSTRGGKTRGKPKSELHPMGTKQHKKRTRRAS